MILQIQNMLVNIHGSGACVCVDVCVSVWGGGGLSERERDRDKWSISGNSAYLYGAGKSLGR